jgi:hypothetical protein
MVLAALLILGLTTTIAAQQPQQQQEQFLIFVTQHEIEDSTAVIDRVVAPQDGFVAIWNSVNGQPGEVIGSAPVQAGENTNVEVEIDLGQATQQLFISLHEDVEPLGEFDPETDPFVLVNGQPLLAQLTFQEGAPPDVLPELGGGIPWADVLLSLGAVALAHRPGFRPVADARPRFSAGVGRCAGSSSRAPTGRLAPTSGAIADPYDGADSYNRA